MVLHFTGMLKPYGMAGTIRNLIRGIPEHDCRDRQEGYAERAAGIGNGTAAHVDGGIGNEVFETQSLTGGESWKIKVI